MPENKEEKPRKGRPPRSLQPWTIAEHDKFMAIYRAMHIGFNKMDRDEVDKQAEAMTAFVNTARGL